MGARRTYAAAIIACARWEQPYIAEWVAYHVDLGFDHIYLHCNDDDPAPFKATLKGLAPRYRNAVSYRPFFGQGLQSTMYGDALRRARREADWLCFLDIDEFVVLKRWASVPQLIEDLDARAVDSLHLHWLFYGNNGHVTRPTGSVLRNYTRRSRGIDVHTKHISRSSCFEERRLRDAVFPFWHGLTDPAWDGYVRRNVLGDDMQPLLQAFPAAMSAYLDGNGRSDAMIEAGYIAHFVLKSEDDFRLRVARGTAGNFNGQVKWQRHLAAGEAGAILDAMNEVADAVLPDALRARSPVAPA